LKVAVLTRHFSPDAGGAEHYAVKLVEQLASRHEIHVFAQHINHDWPGVSYHRISSPFKRPRWVNQWWFSHQTQKATREGFDIVHSHENTSHGNVQSVHVIPLWINYFGLGVLGSRQKKMSNWKRAAKALLALTSPRLLSYLLLEHLRLRPDPQKLVLGVSSALSDELSQVFHLDAKHLKTLIPGVEASESWVQRLHSDALSMKLSQSLLQSASSAGNPMGEFQALDLMNSSLKALAQKGLGLDPKPRHWLLWVGHDEHKKGLSALLDALLEMPQDTGLMLVGKAASKPQTLAWIAQRGLEGRVSLLGVMADVTPAYIACDVLVHPTLEDTFGMCVVEAMAWAKAVVVSPAQFCGVAQEVVNHEHVLLLRDPKDPHDIAQKTMAAIAQASVLGRNALAWTRAHTWAHQASALEQHYQELVQRGEVTCK